MKGFLRFTKFKGIKNTVAPHSLSTRDMVSATNVDIAKDEKIRIRRGTTKLYTGNVHSLRGLGQLLLFVEGTNFKYLNTDNTATTLATVSSGETMDYDFDAVSKVYCTNSVDIGYVDIVTKTYTAFPETTIPFRKKMPAGQYLTFFLGRLIVAKGNRLYISTPLSPQIYDLRKGFVQLDSYIVMLRAVDNGFYVAEANGRVYFVTITDSGYTRVLVSTYTVIPGTATKVNSDKLGVRGVIGTVLVWDSIKGKCFGANSGVWGNLTHDRYWVTAGTLGTAVYREDVDLYQHISIVRS